MALNGDPSNFVWINTARATTNIMLGSRTEDITEDKMPIFLLVCSIVTICFVSFCLSLLKVPVAFRYLKLATN